MDEVVDFLWERAAGDLLPWAAQLEAAGQFGLSLAAVEKRILEQGLLPARYQRNRSTVSTEEQLQLFNSRVAVIGCGGLGGYIIEELARLGVGHIVAIDPDIFEEHNLNRQLLSTPASLGKAKVDAAAARIKEINPAVTLEAVQKAFTKENGYQLLQGVTVAVDALDSISFRLELAETCTEMDIPMVYGAIGAGTVTLPPSYRGTPPSSAPIAIGWKGRGSKSSWGILPSLRLWWLACRWRRSARSSLAKGSSCVIGS